MERLPPSRTAGNSLAYDAYREFAQDVHPAGGFTLEVEVDITLGCYQALPL